MPDLNSRLMLAASLILASAATLAAQESPPHYAPRFDIATYAGAAIPTGTLRDSFDNAFLLGAQGTYTLGSHLDLLGDLDWMRPTTKLAATNVHADVYQTGLGVEIGAARGNTHRWAMRPFADATHSTRNDLGLTLGVGFHP